MPAGIAADQVSYEDLYARWEHGNWRATEIDLSIDREQWKHEFTDLQRRSALWSYSMFFHGEDSVTDNLSPFIDAAPREEQKYFLATQQADEARHAVLFHRFMHEVADIGPDTAGSLGATAPQLTWGFRKVFARLDRMADELRRDRSPAKLAQAITLYHIVIEAGLAQPGQHYIENSLEKLDLMPGFRAGMRHVSLDEQRHIAFGVKMISELVRDPECLAAVEELLREIIPYTAAVFVPPDGDERYVTCFGSTLEELFTNGMVSMESRLRAAGIDLLALRVGIAFDLSVEDRVHRGLVLLRSGYLGGPNGAVTPDPEATAFLFDGIARTIDVSRAPGATIQWEFSDADPWHLRIDNGATAVAPGRVDKPDLVFRCRFEDWVDLTAGRIEPWRALASRKIRLSGRPRMLWRAPKLFA